MTKFRIFLNFQKEEKWLENMAAQGWQLKNQNLFYTFKSAPPEQANIKIDYRVFAKKQDFLDYCSLFEDSGWRHIAGTKNSGNQYFMRTGVNSDEDIFSDTASRAGRYKRASQMMLSGVIVFFPLIIIAISEGTFGIDTFLNPKLLYYTPGLWGMTGFEFWRKFIFETPFALMRGFSWCISFLFVLAYGFFTIKSWIIYKIVLNTDNKK